MSINVSKKRIRFFLLITLLTAFLCGCSATCHNCGETIKEDPVQAGGRDYCSYDCYMDEFLFG